MGQDSCLSLASKGSGQLHSLSLCKDHLTARRAAPLGPAPRSPDERMGRGRTAALAPCAEDARPFRLLGRD